jgi:Fe-S-cluster-containing hydrogenase component 2
MPIDPQLLQKGFTLQAALEVSTVAIGLPEIAGDYNQLLVFGHAGSDFWKSLDEPLTGSDPLDCMSIKMVEDFLQRIGCAYRVVVLANTFYEIHDETHDETQTNNLAEAPCGKCITRPCVDACPVGAPGVTFDLQACMGERVREGSACAYQCLARNACPVGTEYRYDQDQMRYHYQKSLQLIQSNKLT